VVTVNYERLELMRLAIYETTLPQEYYNYNSHHIREAKTLRSTYSIPQGDSTQNLIFKPLSNVLQF
jgi:hypothetical protein